MTNLPPGPKLNALVAEEVMGWRRYEEKEPAHPRHQVRIIMKEDGEQIAEPYQNWGEKGPHQILMSPHGVKVYLCGCGEDLLPLFSTNIAAAWEVVEYFANKKIDIEIKYDYGNWGCEIERPWDEDETKVTNYYSDGLSAPHAICLAALKAVEGK